jgi:hypothetical protein
MRQKEHAGEVDYLFDILFLLGLPIWILVIAWMAGGIAAAS